MKNSIYLVLCSALLLAACHNPYQSGMDALAEQNFEEARVQARESLNDDPSSPESNLLMAEALMGLEKFRQAEPYAKKAFESGQLVAPAGRVYGKILWELGMPVEAVDAWRAAREDDPEAVSDDDYLRAVETALAMAVHVHDFDRAVMLRDELAALVPDHPDASEEATRKLREQWAADLVRRGRYEDAVSLYRELAEKHPDFADAYWFEIGWHEQQLGRPEAAIEAFDKYIEGASDTRRVGRLLDVARRAERLGATLVARTFYKRAVDASSDPAARADIRLGLAELLLSAREQKAAREQLFAFLEDRAEINGGVIPDDAYESAADRAVNGRAPDIAIEILVRATSVDKPGWRSTRALAELYARRAAVDDVERLLKKYVEGAGNTDVARITAGRWAADRRAFELALFFLEPAAANDTSPELWLELARIYSALSRVSDVRRALKTYVKKSDGSKSALLGVAAIYRAMRLYEDAEEALEAAFKEDKTDLSIVRSLESLYDEWRQPAKIAKIYDQWIKAGGNRGADYQITGERFYRQGRFDEALVYLRQAAQKGENDANLQIADIYLRQRRERDMKEALDAYLAAATDRTRALEAVWQRYRRSGRAIEAVPYLEELVELSPDDVRNYDELARLYMQLGQETRAFEMWKRYVESSKDPVVALEMMRSRIGGRARSGMMLKFLEDYLSRNPNPDPRIYKLVGDAYEASRTRRSVRGDGVYPAVGRANRYYRLFLEKGAPTGIELRSFANQMRSQGYNDIAVAAYEKMDLAGDNNSQSLLDYGAALLETGDAEMATEVFAQFFERRERSADAAHQIASQLDNHKRYDAMGPYVERIMNSSDEGHLISGFLLGSKALIETDQVEKLPALADQLLNRTNNPPEARRKVLDFYITWGMWDYAIQQLEQMNELGAGEHGFEIGRVHYQSGDDDSAEQAFREWASSHPAPQGAWSEVAEFYQEKGEVELADIAWTQAVNANASNAEVLSRRAYFRTTTGRVDEGRADFEAARVEANARETGMIWRREAEALQIAGFHQKAVEAAREGLRVALVDRSFFFEIIIDTELGSGDAVRIERLIDEVRTSGFALSTLTKGLERYGYLEQLVEIVEDEVVNGDPTSGFELLVEHRNAIIRTGGTELFTRIAESMLRREQRRRDINGTVGDVLLGSGKYAQAAFLFETAEENGFDHADILARLYMALGDEERALEAHQRYLLTSTDEEAPSRLETLRAYYELQNAPELFDMLLERVRDDERYIIAAFRMAVTDAILEGRPALALDLVRKATEGEQGDERDGSAARDLIVKKFVAGAEELAASGHAKDVVPVLDSLSEDLSSEPEVRDLRLRLAAYFGAIPLQPEIDVLLQANEEGMFDNSVRLDLAAFLLTAGHFQKAIETAEPLVDSSLPKTAGSALEIVVSGYFGLDDRKAAEKAAEDFVAKHPNPMSARAAAANALHNIGYDAKALEYRDRSAEIAPSRENVALEYEAAVFAGPKGFESGFEEWERFGRIADVSRVSFSPIHDNALSYLESTDLGRYRVYIVSAFERYPNAYYAQLARAILAYLDGETTFGRELIVALLDKRNWEPTAVDEVARHLEKRRLWSEVARVIGPKADFDSLAVPTLRRIGIANHRLGFEADATKYLDRYVERSGDEVFACSVIAARLSAEGDHEAALEWANRGLALGPTRPDALLEAGIAGLHLKKDGADDQIARAFAAGYGFSQSLNRVLDAAVEANRADLATQAFQNIASHPYYTPAGAITSLQSVAKKNPELFQQILTNVVPRVAQLDITADDTFVPALVGTYQTAGDAKSAIWAYDQLLAREMAVGMMTPTGLGVERNIWTIQNNLAYVLSEVDMDIERGLKLIRQSMAGGLQRQHSYIDTLGWLYYRDGDLERAEAEVIRALRTAMINNRSGFFQAGEFYSHIAELREARGDQAGGVWYRILVEMLE